MPTWNHIYTAGEDIQDSNIYALFTAAFAERGWAAPGPVVAGYDIQSAAFWAALQFIDAATNDWGPTAVAGGPTSWVEPVDYTGTTWTGMPNDFTPITPSYVQTHALGGNGWTRKYPREFATNASTTYTDGSSFTNGDYARNISDSFVYHRVAGSWIVDLTHSPDMITAYGRIQVGDYIGPWLLNEIRDAVNLFLAFNYGVLAATDTSAPNHKFGESTPFPGGSTVWTTTQAQTVASFANALSSVPSNVYCGTFGNIDNATSRFYATAYRFQAQFTTPDPLGTALAPQVDFYSIGFMLTGGAGDVFDSNGDPIVSGQYTKYDMQTAVAGVATSALFGGLGFPVWCANPAGGPQSRGYAAGFIAVARYNVAGGFTYRP